jgi:hypothetical protein
MFHIVITRTGMVYSQEVLQGFRKHVEAHVVDQKGQSVAWWQAILQVAIRDCLLCIQFFFFKRSFYS